MKRNIRMLFSIIFAVVLMAAMSCICASAEGVCEMNISPKNAGIGEKINVTVEFSASDSNIQDAKANLEYDPTIIEVAEDSVIQGSGGIVALSGFADDAPTVKFDITFVGVAEGSTKIAVTNSSANNMDNENLGSPTNEDTINVGDKSNLEADSKLKELTVSKGQLEPAFSPDVTTYTVNVENDVKEIEISAQMNSTKAYIDFSGNFEDISGIEGTSPKIYVGKLALGEGDNKRSITISAENGEETVYTINVVRLPSGEIAPVQTTPPEVTDTPEDTENMNIFQSSPSTSPSGSSAKNPSDDNVLDKVFPILIIGMFVVAIVLFLVVSFAKMQAEKAKSKRKRPSTSSGRSSYSNQGSQKRVQATVRRKPSGSNSNVRRPK